MIMSFHSKEEKINFIKWTFKFLNFFSTIFFFLNKSYFFLKRRIKKNYYPEEVKILSKTCNDELLEIVLKQNYKKSNIDFGPTKLKICSKFLLINKKNLWEENFVDEEINSSIYRWSWLLYSISEEGKLPSFEWGVNLMRSWIKNSNKKRETTDSYSLGERICNSLLFTRVITGNWNSLPLDLNQFILSDASQLIKALEYYEKDLTGNHLFNNARALFYISKIFKIKSLEKLSKKIIKERLKILITKEGFLREGSSHYHFLFTRWLYEIYFISVEFRDYSFKISIKPTLEKMLKKCNFFLIKKNNQIKLPLIGDISPDFEPNWVIGISKPHQRRKNESKKQHLYSWSNIAVKFPSFRDISIQEENSENFYFNFPKSGWYRINWGEWTAVFHTLTKESYTRSNHSHQDFGSIVLYYRGEEILIDKGRLSYKNLGNAKEVLSLRSLSHNTLEIDGLPICLSPFDNFPTNYQKIRYSLDFKKFNGYASLTLKHNGFDRLQGKKVKHKRSFNFYENYFKITDDIDGSGNIDLNVFLHFLKDPDSNNSKFNFKTSSDNLKNSRNKIQIINEKDWYHPSYGIKKKSFRKKINYKGNLPLSINHSILIK